VRRIKSMSTETQLTIAAWIFLGGGFYAWTKSSIAGLKSDLKAARGELYRDINGIGAKVRQDEDAAARRYHNTSLAITLIAPVAREKEVCDFLREG
jgi:hypothetical protein